MDNQTTDVDSYVTGTEVYPDEVGRVSQIFSGCLLFVISAIAIVGNIATILAFADRDSRNLRSKTSNLLILSLSCSDLVIGVTGLPFAAITYSLGSWPLGRFVCIFGAFFSVLGVAGGMYTLAAINIDRWLLVSREYSSYLRIQSLRNIKLQIAGAWTVALIMSSTEAIIWLAGGERESEMYIDFAMECRSPVRTDPRFSLVIGFFLFLVPFLIMIVCTLRFVVLLRRRLRKRLPQPPRAKPAKPQPAEQEGEVTPAASPEESGLMANGTDSMPATDAATSDESDSVQRRKDSPKSPSSPAEKKKRFFVFGSRPSPESTNKTNSTTMQNRYVKPALRLAILMGVFAVFSLPYPFYVLIVDTQCSDCKARVEARNHLSNLLLTNSAVNPFLYAIMHRQIRKFHMRKLRAIFCRNKRGTGI